MGWPTSQECIGSRIFATNKYTQAGSFLQIKAKLVAKGNNKKLCIIFCEALAPACTWSVRIMLAAKLGLKIDQLGVTSTYLIGQLNKEMFLEYLTILII